MITNSTQQQIEEAAKQMADISTYEAQKKIEALVLQGMIDGLEMAKTIYSPEESFIKEQTGLAMEVL